MSIISGRPAELSWMKRTVISPAGPAKDAHDAVITFACGLLLFILIVIPVLLSGSAAWLLLDSGAAASFAGMLTLAGLVLWILSATVYWLKIDASGLTFGRRAGGPKHLKWNEIHSIAPASRRDVVLHGWLWPPFRPREATRCTSSLGHYRIEYSGGYCFFPPANEEEFLGALNYWRAQSSASRA